MTMGRVGAMPAQPQPQSYAQVQAQYHQMVAEVGGPLSPMLLALRWCRAMAPCDKRLCELERCALFEGCQFDARRLPSCLLRNTLQLCVCRDIAGAPACA